MEDRGTEGPDHGRAAKYLTRLVERLGKERFDAEFVKAVKGTDIKPRAPRERTATASKRLTKASAHKLIGALVGT
ncbi:hypothetical protein ACWD4J_35745 [Streptomyces sp. NPDC002577]